MGRHALAFQLGSDTILQPLLFLTPSSTEVYSNVHSSQSTRDRGQVKGSTKPFGYTTNGYTATCLH